MTDLIAFIVLAVIVSLAAGYVYRAKKRGVKCIGCPEGASCHACQKAGEGCCSGCCGCEKN